MMLYELVEQLGRMDVLDAVARPLSKKIAGAVRPRPLKDLLSGTWLGHPVHPMLTDVPIGAWAGALVVDLAGGRQGQQAADVLIGLGLLTALPTAATGLSDWSDHLGEERRIGLVHAVANVTAVACYGLSLLARRRGARRRGLAWSLAGGAAVAAGGYLGGHLTYAQGVNVNRNAWHDGVDEWTPVLDDADLREQEPVAVEAGDTRVLLVRQRGQVHALAGRCGHAGGPLHEGTLEDGCIICPWHGSTFRLEDGELVHGPATIPQPAYETRVEDGSILIRSATGGGH
ncbi:MAG: Rieske 2Fe-2S domain-containing protein [Nitriliruptorales bacterium]